ncbi:DUF7518 family protein [Halocatena pleomorpha]|uniref:BZIP transcription factor n=1 Tax=Halocatena pleomorpha TaxID=1785090 RepID=A0A3P3R3K8_9EURY|nr:hypothetical protein [Halocatena pleomorpha]RRJ28042.1 hypothetical protein EIK79_16795 [Halocatena pleomorpha]
MGRSDRVEELETQVRELEATVTGLTEELLECKQRLSEVEDTLEEGSDAEGSSSGMYAPSESSPTGESVTSSMSILDEVDTYTTEGEESHSETETEEDGDGIIVA